jgi:hypothetical protein
MPIDDADQALSRCAPAALDIAAHQFIDHPLLDLTELIVVLAGKWIEDTVLRTGNLPRSSPQRAEEITAPSAGQSRLFFAMITGRLEGDPTRTTP